MLTYKEKDHWDNEYERFHPDTKIIKDVINEKLKQAIYEVLQKEMKPGGLLMLNTQFS